MLQTFFNVANSDGMYGAHRRLIGTPQEDRYKQAAEDDRASWCAREFHHHYRVGFPMLDGSDQSGISDRGQAWRRGGRWRRGEARSRLYRRRYSRERAS